MKQIRIDWVIIYFCNYGILIMFWVKIAFVSLLEPNFYTLPVLMLWYFHMNMVAYIISYGSTALSFIGFDVVTFKSEQLWLFTRKSHMIEIINTVSWMRRKHRKQRHVNDIQLLGNGDFLSVLVDHKLPRLLKITLIKVNSLKNLCFKRLVCVGGEKAQWSRALTALTKSPSLILIPTCALTLTLAPENPGTTSQ